ncbi:hypothetical protein LCGC14_2134550, partial [marine sediment metagenome]
GIELGPGLSGLVFKKEELDALVRALRPRGRALAVAETAASIPRQTVTGMMDIGQFGIQMATMFYRRPVNWGKAVARSLQAIGNEKAYLRWLDGSEDARFAARFGVDLGGSEFTEFTRQLFSRTRLGQAASDTLFDTVLNAAPRGFDSALAASRVYEFKALADAAIKAGDPETELYRVARYVNTKLGSTNTRSLGISTTQRQVENAFGFFSARYNRSIFGMIGYLQAKGVPAKDARESLTLLMLGGAATFYAMGKGLQAAGMDLPDKEILRRMDPRSGGEFMSYNFFGNEVGFGTAYRAYVKFIGDAIQKDSWTELDTPGEMVFQNPITRLIRGRTSPVTGTFVDSLTGNDFMGKEYGFAFTHMVQDPSLISEYFLDKFLALNLEAIMEARGGLSGKVIAGVAETVGQRTFPESPLTLRDEFAAKEFKDSPLGPVEKYKELLPTEKREVAAARPDLEKEIDERGRRRDRVRSALFDTAEDIGDRTLEKIQTEADKLSAGEITGEEFRTIALPSAFLFARGERNLMDIILEDAGIKEGERPEVTDGRSQTRADMFDYFEVLDGFPAADVNAEQKELMFEAIDKFRAELGPEREDRMDSNLGLDLKEIPEYVALQADRKLIEEAGW